MRLKQIKLAGFKSFVDPTSVPFPESMTAIVGPNGCGKSNIIDAVRWVLGESSAKNLRGDAMTDVIFNGSSARKPVSQASVELIFENTQGRVEGSLADRSEIAIKRIVNRDAQSTYLLNGSKCRRKDITDIFLGTGLGPRSYAIIEQGMISRLIESKPHELRVFIEEAAGVSKYKERRKETENRIRHTRDNLERLTDVREELGKQLEKLRRQSAAAMKYKELKVSERKLKSELLAIRWQKHALKMDAEQQQIQQQESELEAFITRQKGGENQTLVLKTREEELKHLLAQTQQQFFDVSTQITRTEQSLLHSKQQRQRTQEELRQLESQLEEAKAHLLTEQARLEELVFELEQGEENIALALAAQEESAMQQEIAQDALQQWQKGAHGVSQQIADSEKAVALAQAEIKHLTQSLSELQRQSQEAMAQLQALDTQGLEEEVAELAREQVQKADALHQLSDKVSQGQALVDSHLQQLEKVNAQRQQNQQAITKAQAECETLEGMLKVEDKDVVRLYEQLEVESGWELAVDMALGDWIHAELVNELPSVVLNEKGLLLSQSKLMPSTQVHGLATKVKAPDAVLARLSMLSVASSPEQAFDKKASAPLGCICPQGVWFAPGMMQQGTSRQEAPILETQSRIKRLRQEIQTLQSQAQQLDQQHSEHTCVLEGEKQALTTLHKQYAELQQGITQVEHQKVRIEEKLAAAAATRENLEQKRELLTHQTDEKTERQLMVEESLAHEQDKRLRLVEQHQDNQLKHDELAANLEHLRHASEQARADVNKQTLHQENLKNQRQMLGEANLRTQQQLTQNQEKYAMLQLQLEETEQPGEEQAEALELLLAQKMEIEQQQEQQADQLAQVENELRELELGQKGNFDKVQQMQAALESLRLSYESEKVRANTLLEQIDEMQLSLKTILEALPAECDESSWQAQLDKVVNSVSRLGAINLAAIEEFEQQSERKNYLDTQNEDLESALETLETAIRKIDRETRQRFKHTFEQVNQDLQQLFPKVFGGGAAYLDLTGEDLLETGVSIMARPPGKKNSTIHLLSGGEKALTALSLVFAIFRLNPAPFCMLDEVDAPLDDANVGRFCNLVREMSDTVQFIYISHNKIAMEMASQLTGVTMQEPGVSRMVAVDVEEAVAMAEAS